MLFNTVIPLSAPGINVPLITASVVCVEVWGGRGRRTGGGGGPRRATTGSPRSRGRLAGTFDGARCFVGRFLCLSNNILETGKIRNAESAAGSSSSSSGGDRRSGSGVGGERSGRVRVFSQPPARQPSTTRVFLLRYRADGLI